MSKDGEPLRKRESLHASIMQLGERVTPHIIVVGSNAVYEALGPRFRRQPANIDLAVTPEVYRHLREQPGSGWKKTDDGLLKNGPFHVGKSWGNMSMGVLQKNSWQTTDNITIAGLPVVYAWKQEANRDKDRADTQVIRETLLDPDSPPLDTPVIGRKIESARFSLPEHLRDHPDAQSALRLAGNGLHIVHTLYGDPDIGRHVNQIIGQLERDEYGVWALYHNGLDLTDDLNLLQKHFDNVDAPDSDRLDGMVSATYSDAFYGNGRKKKDNQDRYDELLSGQLAKGHAILLNYSSKNARRLRTIILGTGFNEETKRQVGKNANDPVIQAVAGDDLQILSEPSSGETTTALILEDGMSARHSPDRVIGRVMNSRGVRITSVEIGVRAVDEYAQARPSGIENAPTLIEYVAEKFHGHAAFHHPGSGHQYPPLWTLGSNWIRMQHADKFTEWGTRLVTLDPSQRMTMEQVYEATQEHTIFLRK
jgi:hypothetical protein